MGLELRHLRYFVAVADHGQMIAAAGALHVAQPAVSQTICHLERELGVALFERHPRGVTLTRAGEELLPKARAAISSTDEAFQTARAHAREQRNQLLVGFGPLLTTNATEILAAYERAQPSIDVEIRQFDFGGQIEAVSRRQVDVAFVWAAFEERDVVLAPGHRRRILEHWDLEHGALLGRLEPEPVAGDRLVVGAAGDQDHFATRLLQPRAHDPTDRAGSKYNQPHVRYSACRITGLRAAATSSRRLTCVV